MSLKNNSAPLLCYLNLCASFRSHWWIQTGITVRKRPIWVKFGNLTLKFGRWPCKIIGQLFHATDGWTDGLNQSYSCLVAAKNSHRPQLLPCQWHSVICPNAFTASDDNYYITANMAMLNNLPWLYMFNIAYTDSVKLIFVRYPLERYV